MAVSFFLFASTPVNLCHSSNVHQLSHTHNPHPPSYTGTGMQPRRMVFRALPYVFVP